MGAPNTCWFYVFFLVLIIARCDLDIVYHRDGASVSASCISSREWGDAALWSFNLRRGWRRHRDLPLPLQHTAGCTVKLGQGGRTAATGLGCIHS